MATDIDSIVDACSTQVVCLFDGAQIGDAASLESALPEGVRVVVIPEPDQAESVLRPQDIASQFKQATGAETVIVIEDRKKDLSYVASDGDATAIATAVNSQGKDDGGEAVAAIAGTLAETTPNEGPTAGSGDAGAGGGIAVIAGVVILLAAAATVTAVLISRSRKGSRALGSSRALEKQLASALHGEDGEFIRRAIDELQDRAKSDPELGGRIQPLIGHLSELFARVRRRGTEQQLRLLTVQYKDTLTKLTKAVADDYYGDISRNPQFWSDPEARLHEVRLAVESVDRQAVENIRQVNESRDLEFKVALDSLIKNVDEAKLSDVYGDRAAGEREK